jgi:(1->4)-alpha-D-glucan 1-alpha-D-glucosylmutase
MTPRRPRFASPEPARRGAPPAGPADAGSPGAGSAGAVGQPLGQLRLPSGPLPAGLGATYRIQLQPAFGFADAAAMVPDLARLGIQIVYTSPVTEAVPGSTHGYDGTDPTSLRGELGGEAGFADLLQALSTNGLGLCIDVVPNHLAADVRGAWWRDVLTKGRESKLGELFDIDWDAGPPEARGKVSLPLLDGTLEDAVSSGLLALVEASEPKDGDEAADQPAAGGGGGGGPGRHRAGAAPRRPAVVLSLGGLELPLAGPARLDDDVLEVLAAQHYRLIDWHDPFRDYRRFFDIDGLVGVRVERDEVFRRTHSLVLALARSGALSAVRIDHLDGLADPAAYLRRLDESTGGLPIVIEKILTGDERLRTSWPVRGTTGYEVLDDMGGALTDPDGLGGLVAAARSEGEAAVEETVHTARRFVAETLFGAELERSAAALGVAPGPLAEVTTRLPVYRTYLDGGPVHPDDAAAIHQAAEGHPDVDVALTGAAPLPAISHYQQITGAIMAKGVEDTAWYRLAGPLAFCEVGGDPGRDRHDACQRLHERAAIRAAEGRGGLVPWTTHDTKRGGDVRARLYALSELANAFEEGLARLRRLLGGDGAGSGDAAAGGEDRSARRAGPPGWFSDTRVLAQLALGTIPAEGEDPELGERIAAAMVKGAREAKLRTSWIEPDEAYERALVELVEHALAADAAIVRAAFGDLVAETARLGAVNSLAGVVLRSALPGVPDCYQGDESWNLVLVDPDNRRPPEPAQLRSELARLGLDELGTGRAIAVPPGRASELRRTWRDGRVKVLATAACLHARAAAPGPFAQTAGYVALEPAGEQASSVVAFYRSGADGSAAVAVTTRLASRLHAASDDLPSGEAYAGTVVDLPGNAAGRYRDALTGREIATDGRLDLADVLAELPVALLVVAPPG